MDNRQREMIEEACGIAAFSMKEMASDARCMADECIEATWEQVQADFARLQRIMDRATNSQ